MRLPILLPTLALLAAPAPAQEVHFGLQAGVIFPMGSSDLNGNTFSAKDAVDGKMGFNVGLSVPIDFTGGHTLRPRLDYSYLSGSADKLFPGFGIDGKVTTTFIGADYLYYIAGKSEGFYILVGVGAANSKVEFSAANSISESKTALGWTVGGGWQFTPLVGAELRYVSTHPSFDNAFGSGVTVDGKNDGLNLGVTFRF